MKRRSGFTLIELLTVLAVLSVVSTMGVAAFFKITDHWRVTTLRQTMGTEAKDAFSALRADLGTLISYDLSGVPLHGVRRLEEEKRYGRVPLEDDSLIFPVSYTNPLTGTVVRRSVHYSINRVAGLPRLMRHEGPLGAERPDEQEEVVAEGVLAMRCSYFDGRQWVPEWPGGPLPDAIRVSLVLQGVHRPHEQIARTEVFTLQVAS